MVRWWIFSIPRGYPAMSGRDVLEVPRLSFVAKDELFWKFAPDGFFLVKRAFLARIRDRGLHETLWSSLWKVTGPERIKIFLWRLARDILPFGSRLQHIFGNSSHCVLCNSGEDSPLHLFFHCDVAVQWYPLGERDIARFSTYAISLCFVLWRARNSSFHEGHHPVVPKIQHEISLLVADCSVVATPSFDQQGSILVGEEDSWGGLWSDVNVFVDAAIRGEFGIVAVLVLDRSGAVIEAATAKRKVSSPSVAELEAFHWGCCRILQSEWRNVSIFFDCQSVVKGLAAGFSPEWKARGLFDATRNLLNLLPRCHFHRIPRRLNSGVHNLAAWAASNSSYKLFSSREVAPFVATMNLGC
uniref:Reverse transcriptase zinc-binding domain-containing protein n=1 Tax=Cannabis sativa TaxID=3483 RepID=A0A803QFT8_CANSA